MSYAYECLYILLSWNENTKSLNSLHFLDMETVCLFHEVWLSPKERKML
jgi:predicted phosphatase